MEEKEKTLEILLTLSIKDIRKITELSEQLNEYYVNTFIKTLLMEKVAEELDKITNNIPQRKEEE